MKDMSPPVPESPSQRTSILDDRASTGTPGRYIDPATVSAFGHYPDWSKRYPLAPLLPELAVSMMTKPEVVFP